MELIVEDGTLVEGANTYVGTSESNTLMGFDPFRGATWVAIDDELKGKLLVASTNFLDQYFKFPGKVVSPSQSLLWPRTGVFDADFGIYLGHDSIPKKVKMAIVEIAFWMNENASIEPINEDGAVISVRSEDTEVRFDPKASRNELPKTIGRYLGTLGNFRGGEMRAIKIIRT